MSQADTRVQDDLETSFPRSTTKVQVLTLKVTPPLRSEPVRRPGRYIDGRFRAVSTAQRGENWTKELDYVYLSISSLGIGGSLNRLEFLTGRSAWADVIAPLVLATAVVIRFIKTRAEIEGWKALHPPLRHKPLLLLGMGDLKLRDGFFDGSRFVRCIHNSDIELERSADAENPPAVYWRLILRLVCHRAISAQTDSSFNRSPDAAKKGWATDAVELSGRLFSRRVARKQRCQRCGLFRQHGAP
jgi:hypothetical protein